jgi:hypothetical protein
MHHFQRDHSTVILEYDRGGVGRLGGAEQYGAQHDAAVLIDDLRSSGVGGRERADMRDLQRDVAVVNGELGRTGDAARQRKPVRVGHGDGTDVDVLLDDRNLQPVRLGHVDRPDLNLDVLLDDGRVGPIGFGQVDRADIDLDVFLDDLLRGVIGQMSRKGVGVGPMTSYTWSSERPAVESSVRSTERDARRAGPRIKARRWDAHPRRPFTGIPQTIYASPGSDG